MQIIGLPADRFVDHGSVADLRALLRLDVPGIAAQIEETLRRARRADTAGRPIASAGDRAAD